MHKARHTRKGKVRPIQSRDLKFNGMPEHQFEKEKLVDLPTCHRCGRENPYDESWLGCQAYCRTCARMFWVTRYMIYPQLRHRERMNINA